MTCQDPSARGAERAKMTRQLRIRMMFRLLARGAVRAPRSVRTVMRLHCARGEGDPARGSPDAAGTLGN
jgi:hypothetical protein